MSHNGQQTELLNLMNTAMVDITAAYAEIANEMQRLRTSGNCRYKLLSNHILALHVALDNLDSAIINLDSTL